MDTISQEANFTKHIDSEDIWHRRLGHLNRVSMNLLKQDLATGVYFVNGRGEQCVICLKGKQTRKPFRNKNAKRANKLLGIVHSDLCGPMLEYSWSGKRYIITFIDDFSRKIYVFFTASKDQVYSTFKDYQRTVENETDCTIKVLCTDNGREYINKEFEQYLKSKGIRLTDINLRFHIRQNKMMWRRGQIGQSLKGLDA